MIDNKDEIYTKYAKKSVIYSLVLAIIVGLFVHYEYYAFAVTIAFFNIQRSILCIPLIIKKAH